MVCVAGDGDFLMNGQEFATAVQYDLPIIVLIMDNGMYGTIRAHQEREFPSRVIGTFLRNPDFAAYARAFGGFGATIDKTEQFADAFNAAQASGKPAILHLKVDPQAISPATTLDAIRAKATGRAGRLSTDHSAARPRESGDPVLCKALDTRFRGYERSWIPTLASSPERWLTSSRSESPMVYRRTEKVVRRLAARHDAIIAAARGLAAEAGMNAVQIAPVAERAGIAAGTVYRYFPSKTDLVGALAADVSEHEIGAIRSAADAAPGPLSALAAAVTTFAARALRQRRLALAMIAERVDADTERMRAARTARALARRIRDAPRCRDDAAKHLPEQDTPSPRPRWSVRCSKDLIGPLSAASASEGGTREAVQTLTLFALRAVGVADARARGLVVQAMHAVSGAPEATNEALARIEALEMRITHQDRTIEDLNKSVTDSGSRSTHLTKQVARMADRLQRVEDSAPSPTGPNRHRRTTD